MRPSGKSAWIISKLTNKAALFCAQGLYDKALAECEIMTAIANLKNVPDESMETLIAKAAILEQIGRHAEASQLYKDTVSKYQERYNLENRTYWPVANGVTGKHYVLLAAYANDKLGNREASRELLARWAEYGGTKADLAEVLHMEDSKLNFNW